MNREFKFRVWHHELKRFLTKEEWFLDLAGNLKFYDIVDESFIIIDKKLYIIQQFSGFKDKCKQDIFEGDILSFGDSEKKRLKLWKEGEGQGDLAIVEWSPEKRRLIAIIYSKFGGEGYEELAAPLYKKRWKVIGNVFENFKLLKDEPQTKSINIERIK